MLAHLMQRTSLPKPMPGLSEQASFFLLAVCIRWAPSPEWLHRHAGLAILSTCAVPAASMHTTSELPAPGLLPVLRSCLTRSSQPPQGPHVLAAIHEATLSWRQPSLQRFFESRLWVSGAHLLSAHRAAILAHASPSSIVVVDQCAPNIFGSSGRLTLVAPQVCGGPQAHSRRDFGRSGREHRGPCGAAPAEVQCRGGGCLPLPQPARLARALPGARPER